MEGSQLVGKVLAGRYKLVKLIGLGGMGSVYQGHDQQMSNRVIAVKVLAHHLVSDEKQVARFEQEARAANQLRHPNTISVIDFGNTDGHLFMVMEFLTGETLTQVLRRGRLETGRAMYMIRQVLKSLAEAHSKGIVHRDLKPDNIFVCEIYGEKDFIKVIDFGIAKFLESGGQELTQAGKMFGTPRYLSPEQAQGLPLSAASDLYSLGVILFEMLAGRPPFMAEDPIAVAIKHVQEAPPRFGEVVPDLYIPDELDHMVFKMLAKKPGQRFQSAEEILDAIEGVLVSLGAPRHPSGQFQALTNRTPGRPVTVPPPSRRPQPQMARAPVDDDATRTLDTVASAGGAPAATMAMDLAKPVAMGAVSGAETVALDTIDARAHVDQARAQVAAPRPPPTKAAAGGDFGTHRLLLLLVIAVVLIGGAIAVLLLSRDDPRGAPHPGAVARSDEAPGHAGSDQAQKADKPATDPAKDRGSAPSEAAPKAEPPKPEPAAAVADAGAAAAQAADAVVGSRADADADAAAMVASPQAAAPAAPKLMITSKPEGASVIADGKVLGKTPYTVELAKGGFSRLVVKRDGFDPYEQSFDELMLIASSRQSFEATLQPSKSVIKKVIKKPKWE